MQSVFCGRGLNVGREMKMNSSLAAFEFSGCFSKQTVVTYRIKISVPEYISLSVRLEIIIMLSWFIGAFTGSTSVMKYANCVFNIGSNVQLVRPHPKPALSWLVNSHRRLLNKHHPRCFN